MRSVESTGGDHLSLTDSDDSDDPAHRKSPHRRHPEDDQKRLKGKSKLQPHTPSPSESSEDEADNNVGPTFALPFLEVEDSGAGYCAVYEERVPSLGLDQTPCVRCPSFSFCVPAGPVNAQDCAYYTSWLGQEVVALC